MTRTIPITIDISTGTTDSDIMFYRGDNITLNLTYVDSLNSVDISSATKLCVIAKPAKDVRNGETYFASESTDINTINLSSEITAGYSGNAVISIILLDVNDNVICSGALPCVIEESGYNGVFTPTESYRDEVLETYEKVLSSIDSMNETVSSSISTMNEKINDLTSASIPFVAIKMSIDKNDYGYLLLKKDAHGIYPVYQSKEEFENEI